MYLFARTHARHVLASIAILSLLLLPLPSLCWIDFIHSRVRGVDRSMVVELVEHGFVPTDQLVTRDFLGVFAAAVDKEDAPATAAAGGGLGFERHDHCLVPKKVPRKQARCRLLPLEDDLRLQFQAAITNTSGTPSSTGKKAALLAMAAASGHYQTSQSVCTIDKVKLALDRLGCRSPRSACDRQSEGSSLVKRRRGEEEEEEESVADSAAASGAGMVASACSRCLIYVLVSRGDPRCPRCDSHVPAPALRKTKQPRTVDLNVDFLGSTTT